MQFFSIFVASFIFISAVNSVALVSGWKSTLPKKSEFIVDSELQARVNFWVKVYSRYTTTQGVFHLVDDPSFIFGEFDITHLSKDTELTSYQKAKRIEEIVKNKKKYYATKYKIDVAKIRLQMGLRDRMRKALFLSGKYIDEMEEIFKNENLPIELTRLVYVESSFNVLAQSKVGASGLWQIMPSVAREKKYIKKDYDKRNHPIYATKLAAKILKQNYNSLNSWPLAITAYNHGLAGVHRMVKRSKSLDIADLIDTEKPTGSWGFASKNFYACFLAVLEVEKNATSYFGKGLVKSEPLVFIEYRLPTSTSKNEVLKWFGGSFTRFKLMNPHLNWSLYKQKNTISAGVPLMIPEKSFKLVKN